MANPRGKVLVVDDDPSILEMMVEIVKDAAEEVRSTTDSREVLQILHDWNADVLITDLLMPNMNGTEIIEKVRAQNSDLGIIVISSFATQASRDALQKYLVDAILDKPEGFTELPEILRNLMTRQRKRRSRDSTGEKLRVLIADDHESVRNLVGDVCEQRGFDVTVASDGKEAYESAVGRDFHLIFMDIHMPNMDGIEAIEKIKKANRRTFIVSMTGEAGLPEQAKTKLAGAYTCLHKPFTIDALEDILDRFSRISTHRQRHWVQEDEKREKEFVRRAEEAARPMFERLHRDLRNRGLSLKSLVSMFIISTVLAILTVFILHWSINGVAEKVQKLESFMGRVEGYLERDEQRELEGGPRNPRP